MLNNTDTIECVLHSLRYSSDLFITHAYVFMKSLHLQMVRSCVESAIVKQRFTMNQDCTEGATGRVNEIDGHTFVDTKIHFALQLLCSKSLPKFTFLLFFFSPSSLAWFSFLSLLLFILIGLVNFVM